mmetsp:Transcript_70056/g.149989  ORF Transcript_70056/g.149989 Transcript_70056/m.149989 type:complete len:98 (+) Transcript_70056:978-1271(+)
MHGPAGDLRRKLQRHSLQFSNCFQSFSFRKLVHSLAWHVARKCSTWPDAICMRSSPGSHKTGPQHLQTHEKEQCAKSPSDGRPLVSSHGSTSSENQG